MSHLGETCAAAAVRNSEKLDFSRLGNARDLLSLLITALGKLWRVRTNFISCELY